MSYPIVEQLAQAIVARLQTVTTGNGYSVSLESVSRMVRGEAPNPMHLRCLLIHGDRSKPELPESLGVVDWLQGWQVAVYIRQSETSTTPTDQIANDIEASIHKALMTDATFGGLCIDTILRPSMWQEADEGFDVLVVRFDTHYRTLRTDPYSTGG